MKAGWKNDPASRAFFEIKRAVQRHDARCKQQYEQRREAQLEGLDAAAAEIMHAAMEEAVRNQLTRH